MNIDKLVRMANDIGNYFEAWPDRDAAIKEVANHLRKFWDPRMRRELSEHAATHGSKSGLKPLVAEAVSRLGGETQRG